MATVERATCMKYNFQTGLLLYGAVLSIYSTFVTGNAVVGKVSLKFSYITTKTGGFVSSGSIPVVDLALEQINNRTDILFNYVLSYTSILDSNVSLIA